MKRVKSARIKQKQKRNMIILITLIISFCGIFIFNQWTRSEILKTTSVKFIENGIGTEVISELDVHIDETGEENKYYVILPDKINGYIVNKLFVSEDTVVEGEDDEETQNVVADNTNTINDNINEVEDIVLDNTNSTVDDNSANQNTVNQTNTIADNIDKNSNTVAEDKNEDSLFDKVVNQKDEDTEDQDSLTNTSLDNKNTVTNTVIDDDYTNTVSNTTVVSKVVENVNKAVSNDVIDNTVTNIVDSTNENTVVDETENIVNNELKLKEVYPGSVIYLTEDEVIADELIYVVEFNTKEINDVRLYEQELNMETSESNITVKGFIPKDYILNVERQDLDETSKKFEDVEEFEDATIYLAYDIKIMNDDLEYQPKDFYQTVNVSVESKDVLDGKVLGKSIGVIHIKENEDEILFEKINVEDKTVDSVDFITNEFSEYVIMALAARQDNYILIDDYESDANYYQGRSYTDDMAGVKNNKYNDLAKVNINYYGYDYTDDFSAVETLTYTTGSARFSPTETDANPYRNYTGTLTITTTGQNYIDYNAPWSMTFDVPNNNFNLNNTRTVNGDKFTSMTVNNNKITITGNNFNSWVHSANSVSLKFTISLGNRTNITMDNLNNVQLNYTKLKPIGYISDNTDERQTEFRYIKAVPVDSSNNITLELIDNPFIDRPAGCGFDGWTTNESNYSFSVNQNTKVQKLTINVGASRDVTVNLRANWVPANVVVLDLSNAGNDDNIGSINEPVKSWNKATELLRNKVKSINNASNREVNIIVLKGGTLNGFGTITNTAYTLTGLYNGQNYKNSATVNLTSHIDIGNDLQLSYLNLTGSNNSTSTSTTGDINYALRCSGKNVRFCRGMLPNNTNNTSFAQVVGRPGSNALTYRIVIETGRFANIKSADHSSLSRNVTATLVLGNDYDRAMDEHNTLSVYNRTTTRSGDGGYGTNTAGEPMFTIIVKSGTFGMGYFNGGSGDGAFAGIYLGGHSSGNDLNDRIMIVEGGKIANILGGLAISSDSSTVKTYVYVKGGFIQNIVGGAGVSTTRGDRIIQVTDGTINYSVSGGSNGVTAGQSSSSNPTGQLNGDTLLYIGGNAVVGEVLNENAGARLYDVEAGCILGAGNGNEPYKDTAGKVYSSHVIIDGDAEILNCVYGGGNYGRIDYGIDDSGNEDREPVAEIQNKSNALNTTTQYMLASGRESGYYIVGSGNNIQRSAFDLYTEISNPKDWMFERATGNNQYYIRSVSTGKYLSIRYTYNYENVKVGGNFWNPVNENHITGISQAVYELSDTPMAFTVTTTGNGNNTGLTISNSHTYERYVSQGNGWNANYGPENTTERYYIRIANGDASTNSATNYILDYIPIEREEPEEDNDVDVDIEVDAGVTIEILGGTIAKNVYGGPNNNNVNGHVEIIVDGGEVQGAVYGGSNTKGTISGNTYLKIRGGTIGNISATDADRVFGGGKGRDTVVSGSANLYINDKTNNVFIYGNSFGGSEAGNVSGSSTIILEDKYNNSNEITYSGIIFGGGKGLGNTASTGENVKVIVDSGDYPNLTLFGGCDINGTIGGKIDVQVGKTKTTQVGTVYGAGRNSVVTNATDSVFVHCYPNANIVNDVYNGGMQAGINGNNPRAVYIDGAIVSGNVYGGSYESGTLNLSNVYCYNGAIVAGDVYGAGYGNGANVTGNTNVRIHSNINYDGTGTRAAKTTEIRGNIFGGGRSAPVGGNTVVNINDAKANRKVFGGGKSAVVSGDTDVDIINSRVLEDVYGGGDEAAVSGESTVDIDSSIIEESVYGGGNQGALGSNVTDKDSALIKIYNNSNVAVVYGGGASAAVNGKIYIDVDNSTINSVYGAGEGEASNVTQSTELDIANSTIEKVYGGGFSGDIAGDIVIGVRECQINDSIYGAGYGSAAVSSGDAQMSVVDSNVTNNLYGGGDSGEVRGSTSVYVTASTVGVNIYGGGNNAAVLGSTDIKFLEDSIVNIVFGGGNNGNVGNSTSVNILERSRVRDTVYGGGNNGTVGGFTSVKVDDSSIENVLFGGGKGYTATVQGTNVILQNFSTVAYIYGGGDQGEVKGGSPSETNVIVDIASQVEYNVFAGGNGASDSSTKGSITGNTNLIVRNNSTIGDGSQAQENGSGAVDVYGDPIYNGNAFGGGRGQTATVTGNTSVTIEDSTIKYNVYGGGDNGDIAGNTLVRLTNATIDSNAFGAGNGIPDENHTKHIARVHGNSHIIVEGITNVAKNVFGSGNAAKTGQENSTTAKSIVDISGGTIGKNVYGGANSSVVNGDTVTNIGIDAIDSYHGTETGYLQNDILIDGTVFGGGESMKIGVEDFDFYSISVTGTTYINVDGEGYNLLNQPKLDFKSSIFASGNASSARTSGTITIRNYGTLDVPKEAVSLQRAGFVKIDNSSLLLSGTTDSTAKFSDTYFTLNIIDKLMMKNNSTLYLRNGANKLSEFMSMEGTDGNETKAYVTIPTTVTGVDGLQYQAVGTKAKRGNTDYLILDSVIYEKNADGTAGERVTDVDLVVTDDEGIEYNTLNRIFMYSGINLDIAKEEDPSDSDYGPVQGMTFFGMYKNADGTALYKGMYDEAYQYNSRVNWIDRDYNRCYVQGQHKANHVIEEDGFYTTFEQLQLELEAGESITEEKYNDTSNGDKRSISYMNYIDPTPENSAYYMWYCGPDSDVFYYTFNLSASKFSTLGTKALTLDGISYPNATIRLTTVESSLISGARLVDKNLIPNINASPEEANLMMGLAMKTGNSGWAMNGETNYYSTENNASRSGDSVYIIENSGKSPALDFYLYHSNNITENLELGYFRVNAEVAWKKNLTRGTARIIIDIALSTVVYEGNYYNAAITPGRQFELFTSTTTDITTRSSFSAFFELSEHNFYEIEEVQKMYNEDAYRVIQTDYVFPVNTTITMIDRHDNFNPAYYYYVVTAEDVQNNKREYRLQDFIEMGSIDKTFDEVGMMDDYYNASTKYQYENFIFTVDFENAQFADRTTFEIAKDQLFTLVLRGFEYDDAGNPMGYKPIFAVMDEQLQNMNFGLYNADSVIRIVDADLTKNTIYPGSNTTLELEIVYNDTDNNSEENTVAVHDTRFFDKKMGVRVTLLTQNPSTGLYEVIPGSSLMGTYYTITQKDAEGDEEKFNYYPRADGTTRIKVAEKVSNLFSEIEINTENSTLNGEYKILIESFGSADGIYFGVEASDSREVDLKVVDNIYGLNTIIPVEQAVIDKTTGHTLEEDTGYISETNKNVNVTLEYHSGLNRPYVTVQLLRRNYQTVNSTMYEKVDLADYVSEELTQVNGEYEYKALSTEEIEAVVNNNNNNNNDDEEEIQIDEFVFNFTTKEDLVSGTYRLVYTLYDLEDVEVEEVDENGTVTGTYTETKYQYIGDTYSYLVIK